MENISLIKPVRDGVIEYALDLGCGRGVDSDYLKSLGYKVISVDKEHYYKDVILANLNDYPIEQGRYSLIICNNVLPFIENKREVEKILFGIITGLKKDGATFITFYGHNSGFIGKEGMSFFTFEEILKLIDGLPVNIMDKTTTEGYSKNGRGETIYQHSHRFILKKRSI